MQLRNISIIILSIFIILSCHKEELTPATFPDIPDVYIDGFSAGLQYFPFAGSKLNAFTVDNKTFYEGTSSMRLDIPNVGDPDGAFAGAIFPVPGGRDLSGYDALTFWAKGTQPGVVNEIGFGNDFGENKYITTLNNLQLTTNWKKYTIPLPDPSRLTQEKGLLWYAEGPEDGKGYTFWLDEVKYEKLGTVAQPRPAILNGQDQTIQSFVGVTNMIGGLTQTYNLENGEDVTVSAGPAYFTFTSSDPSVATVNSQGVVTSVGEGTAVITASLGEEQAAGSLTVETLGEFELAPTPTRDPSTVISIFSDAYTNVPVDFYNGYFAPFQTTQGQNDIEINGDNIIKYTELNFVATEFKNPTVNASSMTHFHVDIQIEDAEILAEDFIRIQLGDFGPNQQFDGGDDSNGSFTINSQDLRRGEWLSFDIPLSAFNGLTSRANLAQIFFITDGTATDLPGTITNILVDNMYFYTGEVQPSAGLPIDFENGENLTGTFDGGANGANADNPDQSGINTSSKVYQFNKIAGSEWYSGMFHILDEDINSSDGSAFSFKIWSPKPNVNVRFQLEKEGAEGNPPNFFIDQNLDQANTWVEMTFDFTSTGLNLSDGYDKLVIFPDFDEGNQVPVSSDATYYIDDIAQGMGGGGNETSPTIGAPEPTAIPENVISIFSDFYGNLADTDFYPDWGQATIPTEEIIDGNNTLVYTGLNYQGIVLGNSVDVTDMDFLHIDYWTSNSTALNAFLISPGPNETGVGLTVPTNGNWESVDIPLSSFTAVDLADVFQMKFDGNGDIYLDNIYFFKTDGDTGPDLFPIDFEDGGTLTGSFDGGANGFNTDNPDQSGLNTSSKVYQFNKTVGSEWYSGTFNIFDEDINAQNGNVFKFKVWSPKSGINIRFQLEKEGAGGNPPNVFIDQTLATSNEWVELTFDFSTTELNLSSGYDKIVIFPDFDPNNQVPVAEETIYYFDDITQN